LPSCRLIPLRHASGGRPAPAPLERPDHDPHPRRRPRPAARAALLAAPSPRREAEHRRGLEELIARTPGRTASRPPWCIGWSSGRAGTTRGRWAAAGPWASCRSSPPPRGASATGRAFGAARRPHQPHLRGALPRRRLPGGGTGTRGARSPTSPGATTTSPSARHARGLRRGPRPSERPRPTRSPTCSGPGPRTSPPRRAPPRRSPRPRRLGAGSQLRVSKVPARLPVPGRRAAASCAPRTRRGGRTEV
jgi:hypothetical protein